MGWWFSLKCVLWTVWFTKKTRSFPPPTPVRHVSADHRGLPVPLPTALPSLKDANPSQYQASAAQSSNVVSRSRQRPYSLTQKLLNSLLNRCCCCTMKRDKEVLCQTFVQSISLLWPYTIFSCWTCHLLTFWNNEIKINVNKRNPSENVYEVIILHAFNALYLFLTCPIPAYDATAQ